VAELRILSGWLTCSYSTGGKAAPVSIGGRADLVRGGRADLVSRLQSCHRTEGGRVAPVQLVAEVAELLLYSIGGRADLERGDRTDFVSRWQN
jgi:hypothetical protein